MDKVVRQLSLVLVLGIGIAQCEPPLNTQYGVPGNYADSNNNNHGTTSNGNGFGNHHYDNGNDNDYADQPMAYEFGYAVKDQASGNDFGRRESSDGETVRGEYRVQLPDGRTQIVTYTADWRTGFHADVRYEGTATYPDQYNTQTNGYNNNNNINTNNNNNNNNNNNHNNNNNRANGQDFGYHGNNAGTGYSTRNNGGYNYQPSNGNYNNGNNNYPYQFGSNSLDNSYSNFGNRNNYHPRFPSTTYGPSFK